MFQTEFEFTLPLGYVDADGDLHREGVMRLATAADEILPLKDARVQGNEAYLTVILLSRVVARLGTVSQVTPKVIENLYASDLAYLEDFYNRINRDGRASVDTCCPRCDHRFEVELSDAGGIAGYPLKLLHQEVAFIAYHFHWSPGAVMDLEHADRRRWVREISALNERMNAEE